MFNVEKFLSYHSPIQISHELPNKLAPVTPDREGNVLSCFGDSIWDFRHLKSRHSTYDYLDFTEETLGLNAETIYHFKLIVYYEIFYSKKTKDVLAFGTILGKYLKVKYFANLFSKSNVSSFLYIKNNGIAKNQVLEKLGVNKKITVSQYYGVMQLINSTGLFFNIKDFGFDDAFMRKVKKVMQQAVSDRKQTILIPNRIYSEFIKSGLDIFEKFNQHSAVLEKYFVNQIYRKLSPMELRRVPHFSRNAEKHGLSEFNKAFEITNASSFIVRLLQIQNIGFLLIACFSGMRKSEIQSLGVNCLNTSKIGDREVYTLTAYTAKTSNQGIKRTTWITSELIKPVIDALKVLRIICKEYSDHKSLYTDISLEDYPLLPNFVYKKLDEVKGSHPIFDYPPLIADKLDISVNQLIKNIDFRQSDLDELTHFNPLIDWCEEYKLEIGKNWDFRPHQFRRSLVVYGVRSGYIQFPSLKKQLQHLTIDMTSYYGNQAGSAQNLFDEKIVTEFRKENIRYQFVQYEENVLNNNNLLFGGEGTRVHLSKRTADGPRFLENKKTTYKHFNEGRMAYKKTYLGGCARTGSCDKLGFSYITVCLNCKDAIFDSSSKEVMKKTKQSFLQRLQKYEPDSITYKQLQIEINAIDKVLNKVDVIEVEVSNV